jgi:hypothetical protein
MADGEYERLRENYVRMRGGADAARQVWSAFLVTAPIGETVPPMTGNIVKAYDDLIEAERKEREARDALFALLRPGG